MFWIIGIIFGIFLSLSIKGLPFMVGVICGPLILAFGMFIRRILKLDNNKNT